MLAARHEADDLSARLALDHFDQRWANRLRYVDASLRYRPAAPGLEHRLLASRMPFAQKQDDAIVVNVGLGFGRTTADQVLQEADHLPRDGRLGAVRLRVGIHGEKFRTQRRGLRELRYSQQRDATDTRRSLSSHTRDK